jgi:lipopolysaccharide transport system permease protein
VIRAAGVSVDRKRVSYLHDLVRALVARDMTLRYKRSVLGIFWSLANPLAQMLVFTFLFHRVLPLDIPNYSVFVFSGLLAWTWFQTSITLAATAITGNRELLSQPGFPSAVLPVVTVTTNLTHFLLELPVLLIFLLLSGVPPTPAYAALLLVIGLQFLWNLGLAYLIATWNVTFRDTQHLIALLLLLLFYLTPVFYDGTAVPEAYRALYRLNPMVHLVEAYRAILLRGEVPSLKVLVALTILSGALLWLGGRIFTRASDRFVEEL